MAIEALQNDRIFQVDRLIISSCKGVTPIELEGQDWIDYESVLKSVHRRHKWFERELNPSVFGITMGIETEVFQADIPARFSTGEENDIKIIAKRYRKEAFKILIPRGQDEVWEYAHNPANTHITLAQEVSYLYKQNFIEEGTAYPLHISLGGIDYGSGVHTLMCAIASCGWACNADRLSEHGPYDKGVGGINTQTRLKTVENADFLNNKKVVELRVFYLKSLSGFIRTMRSIDSLGAALKAYQQNDRGQLSLIWKRFETQIGLLFSKYKVEQMIYPYNYEHKQDGFIGYRINGKNSVASEFDSPGFQARVRKLVIRYRAQAEKQIWG